MIAVTLNFILFRSYKQDQVIFLENDLKINFIYIYAYSVVLALKYESHGSFYGQAIRLSSY